MTLFPTNLGYGKMYRHATLALSFFSQVSLALIVALEPL
jgi:hypothetical protein